MGRADRSGAAGTVLAIIGEAAGHHCGCDCGGLMSDLDEADFASIAEAADQAAAIEQLLFDEARSLPSDTVDLAGVFGPRCRADRRRTCRADPGCTGDCKVGIRSSLCQPCCTVPGCRPHGRCSATRAGCPTADY